VKPERGEWIEVNVPRSFEAVRKNIFRVRNPARSKGRYISRR
jgi:hypothetical protein